MAVERVVVTRGSGAGWGDALGRITAWWRRGRRSAPGGAAAQEIEQLRRALEHATALAAVGTLAAGVAHEIRNSLVTPQTFFRLLPARHDDEEFMTAYRDLAAAEAERVAALAGELLSLAKPSSPTRQPLPVARVVEHTVRLLAPVARRRGVALLSEVDATVVVNGSADRLRQVVVNLVLNAFDASRAGGHVTVAVRRVASGAGGACELEVADDGAGIPPAVREHLFEPFVTARAGGTGLGLWVTCQIVVEHGGSIAVVNRAGGGTRCLVHLPLAA
jgi:signal transduction histidine kinase